MKFLALLALTIVFMIAFAAATPAPGVPDPQPAAATGPVQTTVDGVPVCVFTHAGMVIAGVGRCGVEVPVPGAPPPAEREADPRATLPPGHPPIGGGLGGEGERVIAI